MAKSIVGDLVQIFKSSVSAVLPENLIKKSLKYNPSNQQLNIYGDVYNLNNKNVFMVGSGKAVQNMAREINKMLPSKIKHGIISIPVDSCIQEKCDTLIFCEGARNNLPDIKAENTATVVEDLAYNLQSNDILLVLLSGGGSALLPLPKEPITLDEKTELIKKLANSGADIKELNIVRKRLSRLKGGQLAAKSQPGCVVSLIISDIVGNPLDLIASGPTVVNTDHLGQARDIIEKYNLYDDLCDNIKFVLNEAEVPDRFPEENVKYYIIGSNEECIFTAVNECKHLNYLPIVLSHSVTGNVKEIAKEYAKLTKLFCDYFTGMMDENNLKQKVATLNIPGIKTDFFESLDNNSLAQEKGICLILGGEITVQVKGHGKGGRNQQLALEFSNLINNMRNDITNYEIYLLSAGTDGIDGPTDAAGAVGYLDLVADATSHHFDIQNYLDTNDSYNFYKNFHKGNYHVMTGHTNTNVMDLYLIVIKKLNKNIK